MRNPTATAPPHSAAAEPLPPEVAAFLRGSVRTLDAWFAGHGPSPDPQRCRCGAARPCTTEQAIANLLEFAGGAYW
jgi:hypothetical protein